MSNFANLTVLEAGGQQVGVLDEVSYLAEPHAPHFSREMTLREEIIVIKGSIKVSP